jgi:hypothetical protein
VSDARRNADRPGVRLRHFLVRTALIALAVAPAAQAGSTTGAWISHSVYAPVSCVDDIPTTDGRHALGVYRTATRRIELNADICAHLDLLRAEVPSRVLRTQIRVSRAVLVLAHELAHYEGMADEAEADCRAAATFRRTAVLLGATPAYALTLETAAFPFIASTCSRAGRR